MKAPLNIEELDWVKLIKQIKYHLKINDLTVAQLSRRTRVPQQTIHNWLSGQLPRNIIQVKTIADEFKISIDELLFGKKSVDAFPATELKSLINAGKFEVILRPLHQKDET